jgi:hypothetical protein
MFAYASFGAVPGINFMNEELKTRGNEKIGRDANATATPDVLKTGTCLFVSCSGRGMARKCAGRLRNTVRRTRIILICFICDFTYHIGQLTADSG